MPDHDSLALVVCLRHGAIEEVFATGAAQVAVFDLDTEGADDAQRVPALTGEPGRWLPWATQGATDRARAIMAAMPQDNAPDPLPGALTAQKVVVQVKQGQAVDAMADGNVRILVLDRDVRDPDDAMTFPGEHFNRGETFEAVPEWLSPVVDPLRLRLVLQEVAEESPKPARVPHRRQRR